MGTPNPRTSAKFNDRDAIGGLVQAIREHHGETQAHVESAIGVEHSTLSRTENGQRSLKFTEACYFCDLFGLTITEYTDLFEELRTTRTENETWRDVAGCIYQAFLLRKEYPAGCTD